MPPEKHRQDRGCGMANEPADGGAPGRIGHLGRGHSQMRDLSGREYEQHAAILEPAQGLPHGTDVGANGPAAAERIDRDRQVPQRGDPIQEKIRHDFYIRSAAQKDVRHDDAFNPAERMIADDDGRAFLGNVLQVLRFDLGPHIHLTKNVAHEPVRIAFGRYLIIQRLALPQAEQMFERTGQDGENFLAFFATRVRNQ